MRFFEIQAVIYDLLQRSMLVGSTYSMKKGYWIVRAFFWGMVVGFIFHQMRLDGTQIFTIPANEQGRFVQEKILPHRYEINSFEVMNQNGLHVTVKRRHRLFEQGASILAGLVTIVIALRESRKEEQVNYSIHKAKEHPLYPRFIQEDPERQFLEDRSIIREFSSWLKAQNEPTE
jgi:hypothetical protein